MIKERNYMYDSIRGVCMFCVVLQHFLFKGGYQFTDITGDFIYVGIDIFVMQGFFFLSGMFSKNPDKNRDQLFQALLWPVVIGGIIFWSAHIWQKGFDASLMRFQGGKLPYAMWFLVVLFVYRYFQKYYVKCRHLLLIAFLLYIGSGIFEPLSMSGFAVSRMCTFFISFVLGYKLSMEQADKLRHLRWWQTALLGTVLLAVSYATVAYLPKSFGVAVRLSSSYLETDMTIWQGILFRICLLIVSSAWIIFMMNIFSNKKGFWAHIGMNTMPIYFFHLFFAGIFMLNGFTGGRYDFENNTAVYLAVLFLVSMGITLLLSTKPSKMLYNWLMDGTYKAAACIMNKTVVPLAGKLTIPEVTYDESNITSSRKF